MKYKAIATTTVGKVPIYAVVDTDTGEWKHVYDCMIWAERRAEEMNGEEQNAN